MKCVCKCECMCDTISRRQAKQMEICGEKGEQKRIEVHTRSGFLVFL